MLTIRQASEQIASGVTTSEELVGMALEAIVRHRAEGGTAYVSFDRDSALAAARESDAARRIGHCPSPLAGLPISIKDLFDVEGEVTSAGSRVLADALPATRDADAVACLRRAGAILIGRTNMSEFGYSGLGLNPHFGTPRNPADKNRIAGGSTSGGAVSVGIGGAFAALGTDTGGSLRIPSALCGLVGFKPTKSRVSMRGGIPASTSLDTAGPIAASVDCCAIVDSVLSGDAWHTNRPPPTHLRLGVTRSYVLDGMSDEVATAFDGALAKLRVAGATIEWFDFPELDRLPEITRSGSVTAAEAAHWHRGLLHQRGDLYDPRIAVRIKAGQKMLAMNYLDILQSRNEMIGEACCRLKGLDAWLMPTVPITAPLLAPLEACDEDFFKINALIVRNPSVINFLDGCAISIPCNGDEGLPVGLSVCGMAGADENILGVARSIEHVLTTSCETVKLIEGFGG